MADSSPLAPASSSTPTPTTPGETVWTIQALLTWTTDYLTRKGVESPRTEAQLLLAHVLGCKRVDLLVRYDEVPGENHRRQYRELIQRRVAGWPTAYLIGSRDFYLLTFEVTPAVLIPRPDTETLVLEALKILKPMKAPRVWDIGTGSGCIAVSIAHQKKDAQVTASDISPDALEVAQRNALRHGVAERVRFLCGDLAAPIPPGEVFDLIVSNPPYVAQGELAQLAPEVRDHEPRIALDGGADGLAFYRRLAGSVAPYLALGGCMLLEIGAGQESAVQNIFADFPQWQVGPTFKDMAGHPRVVAFRRQA
ncbi:MAG: peptide chain release factor N(5)-glutamine methyltransferase [Thermogemmata sp.]|jgi:release factor glutamine methyltransferase|uniref:Release factor glutamine methyltransferase n=1 Tax=Thermogemmata fonticola TaxID=2755323 RepID=A0A7V9AC78_9BACT|nr:peptide chain release factor N(5)-glutamine methyltransferase [Thermogemmata fonticola]MBA2226507.1 peptide chain release factor N(5)-glutamine methyltransferase [Thermogemmata fonticola]MCX8139187.1 peptide chain release factor N(5)-glutamine methyltransferase [Gemmataceae bacterium]